MGIASLEIQVSDRSPTAVDMVPFYKAALAPLGYTISETLTHYGGFEANGKVDFWLYFEPGKIAPAKAMSFAFAAENPKQVDDVYLAALKAGGKSNRAPARKETTGPGKGYNASIIDPQGNIFDVVSA